MATRQYYRDTCIFTRIDGAYVVYLSQGDLTHKEVLCDTVQEAKSVIDKYKANGSKHSETYL